MPSNLLATLSKKMTITSAQVAAAQSMAQAAAAQSIPANVVPSTDNSELYAAAREAITRFVSHTGMNIGPVHNPHASSVTQKVWEITNSWDIRDTNPKYWKIAVETGLSYGLVATSYGPYDLQLYTCLLTVMGIALDDFVCTREMMEEFSDRMINGQPQLHPLLDRLVDLAKGAKDVFLPLVANDVVRAIMSWVDNSALEHDVHNLPLHKGSLEYVMAKRKANGLTRAYTCFTWEKRSFPHFKTYVQAYPEFDLYLCYINDIVSFFKEELAGEKANYINERAFVTGKTVYEALSDTVDDAIATTNTLRSMLRGTPEGDMCELALAGYFRWHVVEPRYRIRELFGDDFDALANGEIPL